MPDSPFTIRSFEPKDESAVYEICLKTGDSGKDASHLFTDPLALGHIYVGPYVNLEPQSAFVLEDDRGVCGYIFGAVESDLFYRRFRNEWLPQLRRRYREPAGDRSEWTEDEKLYHLYYHPHVTHPDSLRKYQSHLHIDLLPQAQGKGQGVLMMDRLMEHLREAGSAGVHLELALNNERAYRFYTVYGFVELERSGDSIYMGLWL
ncbi:MAG: GNAT family N-acetyltransferase [Candidatus Marinimicrobia bacterium]|nr:GNAT family N-acetyltransferase [Candidatus Neomarinimicrobiota bacterium]MDP6966022.1 GNAT family N-acetyltransferase [Candidatus Neomarinimicrobiota bacterium]